MNQQDKNTEILRLLNCLEPYTTEFQSMHRDIEFAFEKFGKLNNSYLFFVNFTSEEKENNKKNNFVRQETVSSNNDSFRNQKGIEINAKVSNILLDQLIRRETRPRSFSDIKVAKNEQKGDFECWGNPT